MSLPDIIARRDVGVNLRFPGLAFIASNLFVSAMIALGLIDYDHQILPDEITLPGLVLALGYGALYRMIR
jgi:prepilin signal peptidase PulO-like enzyme (type II secretory pathway)